MYSTHKLIPNGNIMDGTHLLSPLKANNVGISEVFFTNNWYNLTSSGKIQSRPHGRKTPVDTTAIDPGMYTFNNLKKLIPGNDLLLNETAGYVYIIIPQEVDIKISNNLLNLMGFNSGGGWMVEETTHKSDYIAPILIKRNITIHLGETETIVDGKPSTMIGRVMVDNDCTTNRLYATPQMHKVSSGELSVISLNIKDDDGNHIDNHEHPIYVTLFIN